MSVVARMRLVSITVTSWATSVRLQPAPLDPKDPHYEEIKAFFAATPSGSFEANVSNAAAAEQFQLDPGNPKDFYLTLEPVPLAPVPDEG